jgi:hypothetical protein
MKKILIFYLLIIGISCEKLLVSNNTENSRLPYTIAFSSGYVFKNDSLFRKVYGLGAINVITTDFCYFPWKCWGFGTKVSYWRAKGHTTILKACTLLQEIPLTFYARAAHTTDSGVQLYGSLGGGFAYIKEKSYLPCIKAYKGLGEVEVGMHYPIHHCLHLTAAFRYLFPPQCLYKKNNIDNHKFDVGGCDLRAGLSFLF